MHTAAIVAILVCLDTTGAQGLADECKYLLNSAIHKMEQFDTQSPTVKAEMVEDTKKSVKLFLDTKCKTAKEGSACQEAGFKYGAILWNAIIDSASELRKSHTA
jgi:hypothetical protein